MYVINSDKFSGIRVQELLFAPRKRLWLLWHFVKAENLEEASSSSRSVKLTSLGFISELAVHSPITAEEVRVLCAQ